METRSRFRRVWSNAIMGPFGDPSKVQLMAILQDQPYLFPLAFPIGGVRIFHYFLR
jgi:hypothetical protein